MLAQSSAEELVNERPLRWSLAALAGVIALMALITRDFSALSWALLAPTAVLFCLWALIRDFPRPILYLVGSGVPCALLLVDSASEISMFLLILVVCMAAGFERSRLWTHGFPFIAGGVMLVLSWTGAFADVGWHNWTLAIIFSWGFGLIVSRLRHTIEELEHTRSALVDQAGLHERRRIARDVHDLVGHSLSVVMLHISGARHLVRRDLDEAERALEQAELAGRESLAEIRRTVGLLRDDSDGAAEVLPSPDLTDIPDLVDDLSSAGVDVVLTVEGPVDEVDATTGLAGYRIVQEALTNATRHNDGANLTVALRVGDDQCEVMVRNQGGRPVVSDAGSGFGLVGMRERARSVGGSFLAGPTPGGWSVEASLPITVMPVQGQEC